VDAYLLLPFPLPVPHYSVFLDVSSIRKAGDAIAGFMPTFPRHFRG